MFNDSPIVIKTLLAFGCTLFALATFYTIYLAYKFRASLTHALVFFYLVTISTLGLRSLYFLSVILEFKEKTIAILLVLPSTLSLAIGLSQVNIYVQLIIRMRALNICYCTKNWDKSVSL
jgi:hypothetical protein